LQRAAELGVLAALDDRARTGGEATTTAEAKNVACWAGLRQADAIRLPARAVDGPSAGGARPQPRTGCRPLEPCQPGPGNGVQDPGGPCGQSAQGVLLPGAARSRVRAENGGGPVRLPRGRDAPSGGARGQAALATSAARRIDTRTLRAHRATAVRGAIPWRCAGEITTAVSHSVAHAPVCNSQATG